MASYRSILMICVIITCLLHVIHGRKDFVCPEEDILEGCKDPKECIYENPNDCGGFIQCDDSGQVYYQKCNVGLKWNNRIKNCDIPRKTTCHQSHHDDEKDDDDTDE